MTFYEMDIPELTMVYYVDHPVREVRLIAVLPR